MRASLAWWAVVAVSCSAPPAALPPEAPPAASAPVWSQLSPDADSWAPDAGPDGGGSEEKKAPSVVTARAVLRARGDGARDLVVLLEPLGVERVAARVLPEHRCLANLRDNMERDDPRLAIGCGFEHRVSVSHHDDTAWIETVDGETSVVLLPADATLNFLPGPIADPEAGKGCEGAPERKSPVTVSIVRRLAAPADKEKSFLLSLPEFKVTLPIWNGAYEYCHGTHDPIEPAYRAFCSSGPDSRMVETILAGDAILFTSYHTNSDHTWTETMGGFRLPCGAKVQFPVFHHFDERPHSSLCLTRCEAGKNLCTDKCLIHAERYQKGSPGALCLESCNSRSAACVGRCL